MCCSPSSGTLCHLGWLNTSLGYTKPLTACKLPWASDGRGNRPKRAENIRRRCQHHVLEPDAPLCAKWWVPPPRESNPRSQGVPGLAPTWPLQHRRVWPCQAPACMKCSSHKKEQIQRFILSIWWQREDSHLQPTGPVQQAPLLQCPVLSISATTSHSQVLPKKPPGTWVVSFSRAGPEPKSHHCH